MGLSFQRACNAGPLLLRLMTQLALPNVYNNRYLRDHTSLAVHGVSIICVDSDLVIIPYSCTLIPEYRQGYAYIPQAPECKTLHYCI